MATSALIPLELYLHTAYEPDADFVDGEVEERFVGEYEHSNWQQALQLWFVQHQREWNVRVMPELRVQTSPTRFRVPDVVVFDRTRPVERFLTHPPIAVFEVLSSEDMMSRVLRKLADYAAMGVQNVFVIDPKTDQFYRFSSGALSPLEHRAEPLSGSAASLDLDAIASLRS